MKAPPFDYVRAVSLAEAYRLLAENDGSARVMAGGQSVLAGLAFRLSDPSLLIDISRIPELGGIHVTGAGHLSIGALTTHAELGRNPLVRTHAPLFADAAPLIAHAANPMRVDEQIRGGVVQGIGGALNEHCTYSLEGQLLVGSMADYLVPMAAEMPDIEVGHVETPTLESMLGAKGAGEAGTAGAPAAIMNAINDALKPFGAKVFAQPFTPERILAALGKVAVR